ncbi:Coiled-coil domain-containing protein 9 [Camelus dromedarius]|uniref:Coiled-coil domain-containing protein 9 n=1 Tax=Camelus dromedarius TaxID=9838 RepID=A0A5N4ECV0_CAMDR|nr:Coiled-coil domain-containing protein 9 [Camelus dromedarius]
MELCSFKKVPTALFSSLLHVVRAGSDARGPGGVDAEADKAGIADATGSPGQSVTLDLKSKEEKDAELDKKIEAHWRKNETIIWRYQEIEEDRKKAELEGVVVTAPRKGRSVKENVAVEVEKNLGPSRSLDEELGAVAGGVGAGGSPHLSGAGGTSTADRKSKEWEERRRQNIEKMNEEIEKIATCERNQREGVLEPNPVRCGLEQEQQGRRASLDDTGDTTLSMTGWERSEYLRWKQEREKNDQERLQRHRKPTGQWRQEWDAEKTDGMFKDGPATALEPSHQYNDQAWARPHKRPTFREFLSQHKAEDEKEEGEGEDEDEE